MSNRTAIFRSDLQQSVLRALTRAPGPLSAAELARQLDAPESSVAREVARLRSADMLLTRTVGRRTYLSPDLANPYTRAARDALAFADLVEAERSRGDAWWVTTSAAAELVGARLVAGDEAAALRVLLDTVNQVPLVAALDGLDTLLTTPASTGDVRWDTLLATSVRFQLRLLDRRPPSWTAVPPLASWWWPTGAGARAVWAMQHTPPELARVGIWFDARNYATA